MLDISFLFFFNYVLESLKVMSGCQFIVFIVKSEIRVFECEFHEITCNETS